MIYSVIDTHIRPMGNNVCIGRKGENLARDVDFSDTLAQIKKDHGDGGKAVVLVMRPGEDVAYPAAEVRDDDGLVWSPTYTDTAISGDGHVEIDYYVGDMLAKSILFNTTVVEAIGASGDTPEPGYDYMKKLLDALEDVGTGIVSVEENEDSSITFHMSDGTEYTTSPLKGADGEPGPQGVPGPAGADGNDGERGPAGADGFSPTVTVEPISDGTRVTITDASGPHSFDVMNGSGGSGTATVPEIGENGNWFINGEDTGKPSRGEQGPAGKDGANGADGHDGAQGPQGEPGADGADGNDGVSPTVKVEDAEGTHTVTITDAQGPHSFTVRDGVNGRDGADGEPGAQGEPGADGSDGSDGFSPKVSTESISGGTRVTITDADGGHTFDVMNGLDGGEAATPEIGENGNWFINGEDTGKPSRGEQGPVGPAGKDGEQGPAGADGKDGEPGPAGTDGKDGAQGPAGQDGADGFSPTVEVSDGDGTHTVTITDSEGPHTFTVRDGANGKDGAQGPAGADGNDGAQGPQGEPGADGTNGKDGVSPTVKVEDAEGTHTVTITDADGDHTFTVLDGKDGAKGADGKQGIRGTGIYVATEVPEFISSANSYQFPVGSIQPSGLSGKTPYYGDTVIDPEGYVYHLTSTANNRVAARYHDSDDNDINIRGPQGPAGGSDVTEFSLTGVDLYQLFQSSTFGLANNGTDNAFININNEAISVNGKHDKVTGRVELGFTTAVSYGTGNKVAYGVNYNGADGTYTYYLNKFCTFSPVVVNEALKPYNGFTLDGVYVYNNENVLVCAFKDVLNQAFAMPAPEVPERKPAMVPSGLNDGATVAKGDTVTVKIVGHIAPSI